MLNGSNGSLPQSRGAKAIGFLTCPELPDPVASFILFLFIYLPYNKYTKIKL
jgi:hypothetical protein